MRLILIIALSVTCHCSVLSQDRFEKAITALEKELDYHIQDEGIQEANQPSDWIIKQFGKCKNDLKAIARLDFDGIIKTKSAYLKKAEHKDHVYPSFTFKEWTFKNEATSSIFLAVLQENAKMDLQECVNKGGITWWQVDNKLYFIMSSAYFMTFRYDKLRNTIAPYL